MGLNRECMDKPYLIGRATAIVERLVNVPSEFVALVQVNPLQKLSYYLDEALKTGDEELVEIAKRIGKIPSPFVDVKAQFYVGYYHQKEDMSKYENRERIGTRIAQLRKEKGLTQEELSNLTGFNRANIGKIEKGKYSVGIDVLAKIADALGVSIELVEKK